MGNIVWAASAVKAPQVSLNTNGIEAILNASPIVQLIILLLVFMSVMSWAIAYSKFLQIKNARSRNEDFLDRFWKARSLEKLNEEVEDSHAISGFGRVFRAGYLELQRLADNQGQKESSFSDLIGSDNFERALRKAVDLEVAHLESKLVFLATTGSTGPFIGLFGTVWGIMAAFRKIGLTGSASLAVVAPGISEALITTAIGLAAAIPAVVLYNHFLSQVKKQEMDLNNFATDFLNIAQRHFFKGS